MTAQWFQINVCQLGREKHVWQGCEEEGGGHLTCLSFDKVVALFLYQKLATYNLPTLLVEMGEGWTTGVQNEQIGRMEMSNWEASG
jgi:hypothetical protein